MSIIQRLRVFLWSKLVNVYPTWLRRVYKMNIGKGTRIVWTVEFDKSINPKGIHIGENTLITNQAMIFAHDASRGVKMDTYIGSNCFIGVRAMILPGVSIGNEVIVGARSVVTKDIPSNCIVAGNPAKIIRENIKCGPYGRLIN